jgi:hypothetical protein
MLFQVLLKLAGKASLGGKSDGLAFKEMCEMWEVHVKKG